ncbi:MAG: type II and III secretion system protein family protein [Rickettsiales bacterium]|nr:type II and III secretion system protein family protein [Rickettsiales bacterium]
MMSASSNQRRWMKIALLAMAFMPAAALADVGVNVDPKEKRISLEINKGQMVRLDRAVHSVMIADPNIADIQVISPRLLFVNGKKIGQTSLFAIDAQDDIILNGRVQVSHNLSELERMVKQAAPDADVNFSTVDGGLVMQGVASSPVQSENIKSIAASFIGQSDKIVNMINTTNSNQVSIQVKVVEMSRSDLKKFNSALQLVTSPGSGAFQILQGGNITMGAGGLLTRTTANTAFYGRLNDTLGGVIDMLETQGLATVLAEPNLTTTSGKTASFLAGGEYPITTTGPDNTVSVEYKPFGVSLKFTPTVLSKERISMQVAPEVSSISFDTTVQTNGSLNPVLLTRKADATVEIGSGQSFVLAGLLKRDTANTINKLPGVGDLPILGALFRSSNFQNDLSELVIIVTPYIVRPVSDHSLQTPTDGIRQPSDLERLLLGRLYRQEPMEEEDNMPRLHGDGGFMLEQE